MQYISEEQLEKANLIKEKKEKLLEKLHNKRVQKNIEKNSSSNSMELIDNLIVIF